MVIPGTLDESKWSFKEWKEKALSDEKAWEELAYTALVLIVAQFVAFSLRDRYLCQILPEIARSVLFDNGKKDWIRVYLQAYEGFLGYWTLKQLIGYQLGDDPFDPGEQKKFCSAYLSAGFPPQEKEILVTLYMKLMEKPQNQLQTGNVK